MQLQSASKKSFIKKKLFYKCLCTLLAFFFSAACQSGSCFTLRYNNCHSCGRPNCYSSAADTAPWRQQHPYQRTWQLVQSVRTCLTTQSRCHVSMHSASDVFKSSLTTSHRETKHRVLCAERYFRFHQLELAVFSITLLCSSWSIRWICGQILAISTEISQWVYIVMTVMKTSV